MHEAHNAGAHSYETHSLWFLLVLSHWSLLSADTGLLVMLTDLKDMCSFCGQVHLLLSLLVVVLDEPNYLPILVEYPGFWRV